MRREVKGGEGGVQREVNGVGVTKGGSEGSSLVFTLSECYLI